MGCVSDVLYTIKLTISLWYSFSIYTEEEVDRDQIQTKQCSVVRPLYCFSPVNGYTYFDY